jgi:hypothetical protein
MLQVISNRPINGVFKGREESSKTGSLSFTKTKSYDEAVDLVRNGWDEPVKDIKAAQKALSVKSNVTTQKARPRNSVVGYAPCVPAAILGLPESMVATERVPSKVKAVTIVYANAGNCGVKADRFVKSGAAILNLVNELELKGYRVRLICEAICAEEGDETIVVRATVKDWRQPLDLKKIAFPIAHPSMLRRIAFRWVETTPEIRHRGWPSGYGYPVSNKKSHTQISEMYRKNGLLGDNEYYINLQLAEEKGYDTEEIAKAAGMTFNK